MERSHVLALVIAYYLSRFDRLAYENLGFDTMTGCHQSVGELLDVNPNTLKNMRDEFDSVHDNGRVGWYQREIRPSRRKVVDALERTSEFEIRSIVQDILRRGAAGEFGGLESVVGQVEGETDDEPSSSPDYSPRGPTGRLAEEEFISYHSETGLPVDGTLTDVRDQGCGYDFAIEADGLTYCVEVKGLAGADGGMLFTAKEWETATERGETYFIALVRQVSTDPQIEIIQNPAEVFDPDESIQRAIQVRYQVRPDQVRNYLAGKS